MKFLRFLLPLLAVFAASCAHATITPTTNQVGLFNLTVLPSVVPVTDMTFQFSSDLAVYDLGQSATSIDPPVLLTLNSDYTVTGGGYNGTTQMQTGSITVVTGGAHNVQVNDYIRILRQAPVNQTSSLVTGVLTAAAIEKALDKQAMLSQQLTERSIRSLQFEPGEVQPGLMLRTARSGKVLGFDSSGVLTYYAFVGGSIAPQSVQGTSGQILVNGTFGVPTTGAITLTLAGGAFTATGTANQVLVNGTSGSAQSAPFTLTLPQSIATTSTVQFGKLGINGSPATNSDIIVFRTVPATTAQASVVVNGSLTAAYDLHPNAFRDLTVFTPTAVADGYCSFDSQTQMAGTVALNHYRGYQVRNSYTGSGTLGEMSGFMTANFGLSGLGNVTFLRGFYVSNPSISGGGAVGQFDGIYMDQLSNATGLVNAIYIAGNNRVFMAGGQIVTSQDLTPPAGATNARGAFTFDQSGQTGLAVMNRNATATGRMIDFCRDGGSTTGWIQQVSNTTIAYNTTSDARLKENFDRPITNTGEIFDRLRPCTFDWKEGSKDNHGFIAQELVKVYPAAVTVGDDTVGGDGRLLHPWGYDAAKLVPVLVAETKDLRTRVARLEGTVSGLVKFQIFSVLAVACSVAYAFRRRTA